LSHDSLAEPEAVFHVNERRILNYTQLIDILFGVIRKHGDIEERSRHSSDAGAVLQAGNHATSTLLIDFAAISRLAGGLQVVTGAMDVTGNPDALAELMANVAIMVNQSGQAIIDKRQESQSVNPVVNKISMEFSIACVVSFARAYGYNISGILYDKLCLALFLNEWEQLIQIFKECLRLAMHKTTVRYLERQFNVNASRQLSAESWWNLRSVTEQERWSFADVLTLVDAHMNPLLDPRLAHRSSTVSGSDWRRLYDWIHREDGHLLWRVNKELSLK
jgi:hypothetical protein